MSEQNLAITLHCIGDGVIATDAGGLITRMNAVAERLTGWPIAQALGHALPEIFRIYSHDPIFSHISPPFAGGSVTRVSYFTNSIVLTITYALHTSSALIEINPRFVLRTFSYYG